jgi:hypothetical protein
MEPPRHNGYVTKLLGDSLPAQEFKESHKVENTHRKILEVVDGVKEDRLE